MTTKMTTTLKAMIEKQNTLLKQHHDQQNQSNRDERIKLPT